MRSLIVTILLFASSLLSGSQYINENGTTIKTRFIPPKGYNRVVYPPIAYHTSGGEKVGTYEESVKSFSTYLQDLPLKQYGSPVLLYNGQNKTNQVHASVIDIPILKEDLIQCADAIIKLRAEYLYNCYPIYEDQNIKFTLTNGIEVPLNRFRRGERIKVNGNKTTWIKSSNGNKTDRQIFDEYLRFIYSYAGTASLAKDMKKVDIKDISVGDVFIKGGNPGHAIIVVDLAINKNTGKKIMLLAQSYMPSQEMHILKSFEDISPWYYVEDKDLVTPEWKFSKGSLKMF